MACCVEEPELSYPVELVRRQASGPHQQGYDYEFVPPLDGKYECSICLLCQREPAQTSCGHRFCRDCILTWIRTESQRCPEDNSPITEQDVFPDNFAKREILGLRARCPNNRSGCPAIVEVGQMEEHERVCSFQSVPCPNGCADVLLKQDVDDHVIGECLYRVIECSLCYAKFPLNQQQAHFEMCPMVSLPCTHCRANLPRQELALHVLHECTKVLVACPFLDVGCEEKVSREHMSEHVAANTQRHLRLLATSHERLRKFVAHLVSQCDGDAGSQRPSMSPHPRKTSDPFTPFARLSLQPVPGALDTQQQQQPQSDQASSSLPPSSPLRSPFSPGGAGVEAGSLLSTAEGLMRELFQRNTQTEQRHREQEIKMAALRQRLAECEAQAAILREREASALARFCGGQYVWRVAGVGRLVQEALVAGHSALVHSPGFYTSSFGYRVCLRLNVTSGSAGAARSANAPYLSLFIHLMRGDYDEDLDWPFAGTITLSLLGRPLSDGESGGGGSSRGASYCSQHVSETMNTKPGLAAFQRPHAERNPKGFGYTEFVALDAEARSRHVRDDMLTVRAWVTATSGGSGCGRGDDDE